MPARPVAGFDPGADCPVTDAAAFPVTLDRARRFSVAPFIDFTVVLYVVEIVGLFILKRALLQLWCSLHQATGADSTNGDAGLCVSGNV